MVTPTEGQSLAGQLRQELSQRVTVEASAAVGQVRNELMGATTNRTDQRRSGNAQHLDAWSMCNKTVQNQ